MIMNFGYRATKKSWLLSVQQQLIEGVQLYIVWTVLCYSVIVVVVTRQMEYVEIASVFGCIVQFQHTPLEQRQRQRQQW